ncbi:MAG TPA: 4a-hydroxytetrahydrobiopterin dehydratase [Geobacteraceae bacterium]|nr:4a-hydroxytetrahydrobiopterin dehydratase [Geobacteraceae bacterium]
MGENRSDLSAKHCKPCEGGTPPLVREAVENYLIALPGWEHADGAVAKCFEFKNYYQTIAFVNAVAWISHSENHHPELEVSYRFCKVRYTTHAIGGLSENDFICAAKVEALIPA